MNIWKIASRWSKEGSWHSTILDLFWKHGVAFFYSNTEEVDYNIKPSKQGTDNDHDLIAIADGKTVVAVAKPLSEIKKLSKLGVHFSKSDLKKIGNTPLDEIAGIKVKIFEICKDEQFHYESRRRFCQIKKDEIRTNTIEQWEKLSAEKRDSEFKIEASTMRVKGLLQRNPAVESYVIPIYQRPYSWGETEIERFLGDIFSSIKRNEELFIGTMQLSHKHILSPRYNTYFQEVIDGQQRLTTCALILHALKLLYPEPQRDHPIQNNEWLETRVANGIEQKKLDAIYNIKGYTDRNADENLQLNRYVENCLLICEKIRTGLEEDKVEPSDTSLSCSDIEKFVLNKLVFVVIETQAGLSKTLQIFNTINTAGLDLNGSDLFKVRAYEYLTDKLHHSKDCFEEISCIYELVERKNLIHKKQITTINEILWLYQKYTIAKNDLPNELNKSATETYYHRLFDSLLGVKVWDNYQKANSGNSNFICLDTLKVMVDYRYESEKRFEGDKEIRSLYKIIEYTYYQEYWSIPLIIQSRFNENNTWILHEHHILKALAKLFIVYTLIKGRIVDSIRTFVSNITKEAFTEQLNPEEFVQKIIEHYAHEDIRKLFEEAINGPIAFNPKRKNLVCRLLEYLNAPDELDNIFQGGYDIEHIQSYNDQEVSQRDRIRDEWTKDGIDYLNGIGNLMLLEYEINRSLKNKTFSAKRQGYLQSQCSIANNIANKHIDKWDLSDAEERHKDCIGIIMKYIFNT